MSPKKSKNSKGSKKENLSSKRKTISPIETEQVSTGFPHIKTCQTGLNSNDNNDDEAKRVNRSTTPTHFTFGTVNSSQHYIPEFNWNMNFSGAPQYGTQFGIASPPCNKFGTFTQNSQVPPMWASEMIEDIKKIKTQVSKIDKIEEGMNKLNNRVELLEKKVDSVETSLTLFNEQFEMTKRTLTESKNQIKEFQERIMDIENTVHTYDKKISQIDEATDKLEFHSLRENLLFHGIAETSSQENCDDII